MNNKKSQSYVGRAVKNYFSQNWGILLGLAILCVIFSIFGNNFLTQKNILNLLRTCATNCFLAIGVQMAIILAGIDLTGGALAGFCGVVLASRLASGQPSTGEGYETDAIAAAVLGGTSFFGGTGSVGGLLIGVLIIGLISNGLNLMHVNSYWQFVLKGIIIIAAVYVDMVKQKKQNAAK